MCLCLDIQKCDAELKTLTIFFLVDICPVHSIIYNIPNIVSIFPANTISILQQMEKVLLKTKNIATQVLDQPATSSKLLTKS